MLLVSVCPGRSATRGTPSLLVLVLAVCPRRRKGSMDILVERNWYVWLLVDWMFLRWEEAMMFPIVPGEESPSA